MGKCVSRVFMGLGRAKGMAVPAKSSSMSDASLSRNEDNLISRSHFAPVAALARLVL